MKSSDLVYAVAVEVVFRQVSNGSFVAMLQETQSMSFATLTRATRAASRTAVSSRATRKAFWRG